MSQNRLTIRLVRFALTTIGVVRSCLHGQRRLGIPILGRSGVDFGILKASRGVDFSILGPGQDRRWAMYQLQTFRDDVSPG